MNSRITYLTRLATALALSLVVNGLAAGQAGIGFENIPGGAPVDGMTIDTQFQTSHGVTFSLANGSAPVLARRGAPQTAFQGHLGAPDEPAPGAGVGLYFLTDDGSCCSILPSDLIISFSTPVAGVSGDILDIDGTEEWTIGAWDTTGNFLGSTVLGPGAGSGGVTPFAYSLPIPAIAQIRLSQTGVTTTVGWALDNIGLLSEGAGTGQANSPQAGLRVNGVGGGSVQGPFGVVAVPGGNLQLEWQGPPNMPVSLWSGTPNPAHLFDPCVGSVDIGTPPFYFDLALLFDGTDPLYGALFTLNPAGHAMQAFSLPALPPGLLLSVQGLVLQPAAAPCPVVLTAAFQIAVL